MLNILFVLPLLFLTACNHLPKSASAPPLTRQYHQKIDLAGRLAVQYEQNNQPQAVHLNFTWSQSPQQTTVMLTSPTGQTLGTLIENDQGAQLTLANKPAQFANNANELILNTLGWPLPVANLREWLQGFINKDHQPAITASISFGTWFLLDGWNLQYVAWQKTGAEERPKRLDLTHQTEQAGLVSLRIVIDDWNAQ